jgi:alpha-tubulin suppressor-like RCC1 family protein
VADPTTGFSGTRWTAVTVGGSYTCALRDDGTLWCFGSGDAGQLGQNTQNTTSATPLRVGTRTDWRTIDAGLIHVCGIYKPTGERARIACWGNDANQGRIGDGTPGTNRYVPTDVSDNGASDWQRLAASDYATCALESAGQLWCWGDQYHVPGGVRSTTPTRFGSLAGYDRVSLGAFGGCTVDDGVVSCFGYNLDGAVGYPPIQGMGAPTVVGGVSGVVEIGAGSRHACALDSGGTIECWGDRGDGQLGDGIVGDPRLPTEVLGDHHPWRDVWVSTEHTCAVTMAGQMYC